EERPDEAAPQLSARPRQPAQRADRTRQTVDLEEPENETARPAAGRARCVRRRHDVARDHEVGVRVRAVHDGNVVTNARVEIAVATEERTAEDTRKRAART